MTKPSAPATISWLSSVLKPRVEGLKDRGERIASALGRHPFLVALAGTSAVGGSAVYSSWDAVAQWLGDRIAAHVAYCGGLYDNGKASVAFGLPKLTRRSSIFGHTESSGVSLTRLLFDVDAAGAPPVLDEALSDRVSRVLAHSDAFVGKGVIALTGPPRCGKSAFLEAFLRALRFEGRSDDVRLSIIEASSNIWELVDAKTFKRRGDTPLARVLLYLSNGKPRWYDTRRRQILVVLDDFEHYVPDAKTRKQVLGALRRWSATSGADLRFLVACRDASQMGAEDGVWTIEMKPHLPDSKFLRQVAKHHGVTKALETTDRPLFLADLLQ
ncbi:MAG: hypothetical protein MHM6MM_002929 [Cercozoa sp. M6MM]